MKQIKEALEFIQNAKICGHDKELHDENSTNFLGGPYLSPDQFRKLVSEMKAAASNALAALEKDGYVLVPVDAIPSKKPVQIFEHDEKAKTVLLDQQTYRDLNRCACLLHKAAQEG